MWAFLKIIFAIINWSGIVGGIWLLCLGEWKLVLWSLLFLCCFAKFIIAVLCIIPILPTLLLAKWGPKSRLFTSFLIPICAVAHPLGVAAYGTLVIHLFCYQYLEDISINPLLLLVLGLGTSPWQWFAIKENNEEGYVSELITELMFFITCIILRFNHLALSTIFLILFFGQLVHPIITFFVKRKDIFSTFSEPKAIEQKQTKNTKKKSLFSKKFKDNLHNVFSYTVTLLFFAFIIFSIVHLVRKQNLKNECDLSNVSLWENAKKDMKAYTHLKECIGKYADINKRDQHGATPLFYATDACISSDLIEYMINLGADVNAKTTTGWTPLLVAANSCGDEKITELLVKRGADMTVEDAQKNSVIHLATNYNPNKRIPELLLSLGCPINDSTGINPILYVVGNKEHIKLLQKFGAEINEPSNKECFRSMTEIKKEEDIMKWMKNCTPLMVFSASPKMPKESLASAMQNLIDSGADTEIKDESGSTALLLATATGNTNALEFLINNGASVNIHNKMELTPLKMTILNEDVASFDVLLKKKPVISEKDEKGRILGLELDLFGNSICTDIKNIKNSKIRNYFMQRMKEVYPKEFICK